MSNRANDSVRKKERLLRIVLVSVRLAAVAVSIYAIWLLLPADKTTALHAVWRPVYTPSILAALLMSVLLWLLNRPKSRSHITLWFSLYVLIAMAVVISITYYTSATNLTTYYFWESISNVPIVFVGPVYLLFVLAYLGKEEVIYKPITMAALIVPSALILMLANQSPVGVAHLAYTNRFGYQLTSGITNSLSSQLQIGWIYLFVFIGILLLLQHRKHTKSSAKRKQINIILFGTISPFFTVFLAVFIQPLNAYTTLLSSLGDLLQVSIIAYAIMRYSLFTITPAALSDTILATMNEAVLALNPRFAVEKSNSAATNLLGKTSSEELEERPIQTIFGTEIADSIKQKLASNDKDSLEFELSQHSASTPVSLRTSVIKNSDGSTAGYILVFRDVTKERAVKADIERQIVERTEELHQEQTKLKTSIESLSVGFVMIDADNNVLMSNEAVNQIIGTSAEGWSLPGLAGRFTHGFDLEAACAEVRQTHKRRYFEKVPVAEKIVRVFIAPVAYRHDAVGLVVLLEDVTEQEVLNRSKDEFFSIASHELRTPLTAIRGNTSMILGFYKEQLKDKELKEMVYDIHESSTRLIDVVNDFLDVSRLEQGKVSYNIEEVALEEVVETVIYEMRAVLREKHLSLDFNHKTLSALPKVWVDKNRLKQVIYNLVGNAAKFTEKGSITLHAEVVKDHIKVLVTDTGRGISPEGQKLLFHKFQQAGESLLTRDTTRGTGLGLYISKMMIVAMGGSMALEYSEIGKGTTFSFTIPVATEQLKAQQQAAVAETDSKTGLTQDGAPAESTQSVASQTPEAASVQGETVKLLIVEDDPYVVRLYRRLFSFSKLDVKTAGNGAEGIALAKTFKPHLILLDIMMPVMNGLEALEKLKADTETRDIPVVMLSSVGEEPTLRAAMTKGAANYLLKSDFTPEQVLVEIEKILNITLETPTN